MIFLFDAADAAKCHSMMKLGLSANAIQKMGVPHYRDMDILTNSFALGEAPPGWYANPASSICLDFSEKKAKVIAWERVILLVCVKTREIAKEMGLAQIIDRCFKFSQTKTLEATEQILLLLFTKVELNPSLNTDRDIFCHLFDWLAGMFGNHGKQEMKFLSFCPMVAKEWNLYLEQDYSLLWEFVAAIEWPQGSQAPENYLEIAEAKADRFWNDRGRSPEVAAKIGQAFYQMQDLLLIQLFSRDIEADCHPATEDEWFHTLTAHIIGSGKDAASAVLLDPFQCLKYRSIALESFAYVLAVLGIEGTAPPPEVSPTKNLAFRFAGFSQSEGSCVVTSLKTRVLALDASTDERVFMHLDVLLQFYLDSGLSEEAIALTKEAIEIGLASFLASTVG